VREATVDILRHPLLELDIDIERTADLILLYLSELHKWNRKINLTSAKDERSILTSHIFDSLQYSKAIGGGCRILDIGSGAGFPGLPLKIIFPDREFALIESRRKRASFLSSTIRKLGLEKIQVFNDRSEDLAKQDIFVGKFDIVLFRAVSSVADCLLLGAPFVNDGGRIIIKKEPGASKAAIEIGSLPMSLINTIPITSYEGQKSELLVFARCST